MPKETIQVAQDRSGLARTGFLSATELTLHWSKGEDAPAAGYVQIGLTRHVFKPQENTGDSLGEALVGVLLGSPCHADHSHCSECASAVEWRENVKANANRTQMVSCDSRSEGPDQGEWDPPATVFTDELTRDQINHLIKALRRARDQAFGADA